VARLLFYLGVSLISTIVLINSDPASKVFAVSAGLAAGFAVPLVDTLVLHSRLLTIAWYSVRTWNKRVRISASYLYRIRVDGDYLLVKGHRFDNYQPVGGVYKTHPSSSGRLRDLNVLDDNLLVPDEVSEADLRIRIPGRNLLSFVKWYEGERGRETDGWREFYEELVATGILPQEAFRVIKYDRISRRYNPMRYSQWAQSEELLIADVLELLPTDDQLAELRRLKDLPDSRILWASENQIRRLGAADGASSQTTRIAQTAGWTIDTAN
jgi:hypothetical protein